MYYVKDEIDHGKWHAIRFCFMEADQLSLHDNKFLFINNNWILMEECGNSKHHHMIYPIPSIPVHQYHLRDEFAGRLGEVLFP